MCVIAYAVCVFLKPLGPIPRPSVCTLRPLLAIWFPLALGMLAAAEALRPAGGSKWARFVPSRATAAARLRTCRYRAHAPGQPAIPPAMHSARARTILQRPVGAARAADLTHRDARDPHTHQPHPRPLSSRD